jgi:hypothetical protein
MEKPRVELTNPNDFIRNNNVPKPVVKILKSTCYDCHSNETNFPWYSKIAPVKWVIYNDVKEARENLNFSNWNLLSNDDKLDALFDISDVVEEGEMPLKIYTFKYSEVKLTKNNMKIFTQYFENLAEE